jgi:hypothetical protein
MLNPDTLIRDGKIRGDAIERGIANDDLVAALKGNPSGATQAGALALAAGISKVSAATDPLAAMLGRGDAAGKMAAWALAQLGAEAPVLRAIDGGSLDARENGYFSCAVMAANGRASANLAPAMSARVDAEIKRVKEKSSGLGEQPCRVLAILGAPNAVDLIQRVTENDPYTDRFELQRLRKAIADRGRDEESIRELSAPWTALFADYLAVGEAAPAPEKPAAKSAEAHAEPTPPQAAPEQPVPADEDGAPAPVPINWKDFLSSPEATALPAPVRSLITQLGPLLEQLAVRAINAALTDLNGQEFAALLLQVLPQALPPQHVQAALSPQALTGYQALAKYFSRTGASPNGEEMATAVKFVRKQLAAQIRQSGILGGPDYSDPDEPKQA